MNSIKNKKIKKGLFLVFEGTDGVGKTTCIKLIKEILRSDYGLDAIYHKGIGSNNLWGKLAICFPSTLMFLIELLVGLFTKIKPYYFDKKIILQDRYFFSVASHMPESDRWFDRAILKLANPLFTYLKPDLIFHFSADLAKQITRIKETANLNRFHQFLIEHPKILQKRGARLQSLLISSQLPMIKIDTSSEPSNQIAQKITSLLKNSDYI